MSGFASPLGLLTIIALRVRVSVDVDGIIMGTKLAHPKPQEWNNSKISQAEEDRQLNFRRNSIVWKTFTSEF